MKKEWIGKLLLFFYFDFFFFFYFSQYLRDILLVGYLSGLKKMLNIDKI